MSYRQQALILIAVWVVIFVGQQLFVRPIFVEQQLFVRPSATSAFPCAILRDSPIFALDFELVSKVGSQRFLIEWIHLHYATEITEEGPYVSWKSETVQYHAYFDGADLDSIQIAVPDSYVTLADITACFGNPSTTAILAAPENQTMNLTHIWYHERRMFAMGAEPSTQATERGSPLDPELEIRSLYVYSPDVYADEWR